MKRVLVMISVLAVCGGLVLSGCKGAENDGGSNSASNSNDNGGDADSDGDNDNDSGDSRNDYANSETAEFIHSTVDENGRFVCKFLGLGAELGEKWEFIYMSSYENKEEFDKNVENNGYFLDVIANGERFYFEKDESSGVGTYNFIRLLYMLTDRYNDMAGTILGDMTTDEYADHFIENNAQSQFDGVISVEKKTVKFAGRDTVCVELKGDIGDFVTYSRFLFLRNGNYMAVFQITSVEDEDYLDEITAKFYSL